MSEPAVWGSMHWGNFRWGLYRTPSWFSRFISRLTILSQGSMSVTWKERISSGIDSETGKPTFTFAEHEIDAIIQTVNVNVEFLPAGVVPIDQIRVYCLDGVKHLDRVIWDGKEFEVKFPPEERMVGRTFFFRTCSCERLKQ